MLQAPRIASGADPSARRTAALSSLIARADPLAWAAPLAVFILYFGTVPPGVMVWDTGEAQTVPYLAGLFHPTGFPAYAIAGWAFSHLFAVGNVAWRMNLFSAICGAISVALLAAFARGLGASALYARLAALLFGVTPNAWLHNTRAAVEPFAAVVFCAALLFAQRQRLAGVAIAAGVAFAAHPFTAWLWPGLWLMALRSNVGRRSALLGLAAGAGAALLVAAACYTYLPIRANQIAAAHIDPTEGLPVASSVIWKNDDARTPLGMLHMMTGGDNGGGNPVGALPSIVNPLRYPAFIADFAATLWQEFGVASLLAIAGVYALRRERLLDIALLAVAFGIFPFAASYSTQDAAKYLLPSLWVVAALIAAGATAIANFSARPKAAVEPAPARAPLFRAGGYIKAGPFQAKASTSIRRVSGTPAAARPRDWRRGMRWAPLALFAAALVGCLSQFSAPMSQRNDGQGRAAIDAVRNNTPDDAIIVTQWWFSMPLMYEKFVENGLGNRVVVCSFAGILPDLVRFHPRNVYIIPMLPGDTQQPNLRFVQTGNTWPAIYAVSAK